MKALVLITDYPRPDGTHAYMFAHVRNQYYAKHDIDVTVLNFASGKDYCIDGINVITLSTYQSRPEAYDVLISHASNLRNHYRFIRKYGERFRRIFFFFHGQEVLYLNESYPEPYPFVSKNSLPRKLFRQGYDWLKLRLWSGYYRELAVKSEFIFVSQYIFDMFKKNTRLSDADLLGHAHIIHNSIGEVFEHASYDITAPKTYDFITIRSNWDSSTYCIDLLVKLAEQNPDSRFLLIGRGSFFQHHKVPDNMELVAKTISHREMVAYLNCAKCAINLTRQDTQGVMTCELISFGIPVITSDIPVCRALFSDIDNLRMISNDLPADIRSISRELSKKLPYGKVDTFNACNTVAREVALLKSSQD